MVEHGESRHPVEVPLHRSALKLGDYSPHIDGAAPVDPIVGERIGVWSTVHPTTTRNLWFSFMEHGMSEHRRRAMVIISREKDDHLREVVGYFAGGIDLSPDGMQIATLRGCGRIPQQGFLSHQYACWKAAW